MIVKFIHLVAVFDRAHWHTLVTQLEQYEGRVTPTHSTLTFLVIYIHWGRIQPCNKTPRASYYHQSLRRWTKWYHEGEKWYHCIHLWVPCLWTTFYHMMQTHSPSKLGWRNMSCPQPPALLWAGSFDVYLLRQANVSLSCQYTSKCYQMAFTSKLMKESIMW